MRVLIKMGLTDLLNGESFELYKKSAKHYVSYILSDVTGILAYFEFKTRFRKGKEEIKDYRFFGKEKEIYRLTGLLYKTKKISKDFGIENMNYKKIDWK